MRIIAALLVVFMASAALAADWPVTIRRTNHWGVNYTPDENKTSPTLFTGKCDSLVVSCWGTNLSATLQLCREKLDDGIDLNTAECGNITETAISCGAANQTLIVPETFEYIRFDSALNFGSSQYFRVWCN